MSRSTLARTMAGYEVTARIVGVAPRRAHRGPGTDRFPATHADGDPIDLVGRPLDVTITERWETFRERWAQTTFFLFDPDSWRQ